MAVSNVYTGASQDQSLDRFVGQYESVAALPDAADLTDGALAYVVNDGFYEVSSGSWAASSAASAAQLLAAIKTVDGSSSGLDADLVDGKHASATPATDTVPVADGSGELAEGWYKAAALLSKLLTVDGASSGLNADQVDGNEAAALLARANHTGTQLASTVSDFTAAAQAAIDKAHVDGLNVNADQLDGNEAAAFALLAGATFTGRVAVESDGSAKDLLFSDIDSSRTVIRAHDLSSNDLLQIQIKSDGTWNFITDGGGDVRVDDVPVVTTTGATFDGNIDISKASAILRLGSNGDYVGPHGIDFFGKNNTVAATLYFRTTPDTLNIEDNAGNVIVAFDPATLESRFQGGVEMNAAVSTPPNSSLGTTGTLTLDFSAASLYDIGPLTGNVTFASSNLAAGRSVSARVVNGGTQRTLTFPADWTFVGSKPTDIAASKTGWLTLTSMGIFGADILAAWAVEE